MISSKFIWLLSIWRKQTLLSNHFRFCQLKTLGASIDAIATGSCEILGILGNTLTNTVSKIENPIAALNVFGGASKKPTKKAYFGLF